MSAENRRNFYRLYYTESYCPYFRLNGLNIKVFDVSETGMRFENLKKAKISFNDAIAGALTFPDGETYLIRGTITRLTDNEVCLNLKTPIPLRKIMSEQRELISRFPKIAAS